MLGLKTVLACTAGVFVAFMPCETQNAVANGDTRTIQLFHAHTKESISATFLVNGAYDQSVLEKLNWFLRDWRRDEPTKMDPKLFDTIWEVYRESGSHQPIEVMSAYRSPETNAMLRRRSRSVAEHSQHILGKAMDQHYLDVPMSRIREIAMRLQRGGVGFYPTAGTPFVHMDVGGVRHWPRMSYDQLARLFPDGKTVHIPSNGQPLPGYELARAEIEARGGESYPTASDIKSKGFFAWLFGSGDEDEESVGEGGADRRGGPPARQRNTRVAVADRGAVSGPPAFYQSAGKDGGVRAFLTSQQAAAPEPQPSATYGRIAEEPPPAPVPPTPAAPPPLAAPSPQMALADAMNHDYANAPVPTRGSDAPQPIPNLAVSAETLVSDGLAVPVPPRRPVEIAALSDQPLPPIRPAELSQPAVPGAGPRGAKLDAIGTLLGSRSPNGLRLPPVITQGSNEGRPVQALSYAAGYGDARGPWHGGRDVPLPVARPADLVRARLDRANFRSLTSVAKTDATASQPGLGAAVVGVRAASRAKLEVYATNAKVMTSFGNKAYDLAPDRFSGVAVKPQDRVVTSRRAEAATAKGRDD